jgi:glycine/D-amino acid oxidase-like deaminating enzyme
MAEPVDRPSFMRGTRVGGGHYDVAVIGAGIVGLAHALAAARRGKSVVVIDRDAQANGASIRNFGFVTVTGQQQGACWSRAMRSRDVWAEIVAEAGIAVAHEGLAVIARRPEAMAVLESFRANEMGRD